MINNSKEINVVSSYGGLFPISNQTSLAVVPVSTNITKTPKKLIKNYKNYNQHLQTTTFFGYIKVNRMNNGVLLTGAIQQMIYAENVELNITHYADYFYKNNDMNDTDHEKIIENIKKVKYKGTIENINPTTILRNIKIYDILS